jgi:hypothetical protein
VELAANDATLDSLKPAAVKRDTRAENGGRNRLLWPMLRDRRSRADCLPGFENHRNTEFLRNFA